MKSLLFFLLFVGSLQSQNFTHVDNLVGKYPNFSRVEDLANKIAKDFTSEEDKVRAAFYWLATNIRYDLKEYYNPSQRSYNFRYSTESEKQQKLQAIKDKIVATAFATKYGVCEEYAQAFKKICDLLGIEAAVISGNVRNVPQEIGKPEKASNHAWNAVKLNDKWVILDATWAAGYEYNGRWVQLFNNYFYDIPKHKILKTHYPKDTLWLLRFGRMSVTEFYNQPIYGNLFLNSDVELITPQTGILNVNPSKEIRLKFKNLNANDLIFYTFNGQRYAQKPIILVEKESTTLLIKNAKANSYLNVFINKDAALQFKTK